MTMHKAVLAAACSAAVLLHAPAANAQAEWRFTPYLWAAGFDGTIGTSGQGAGLGERISFDFGKLSDNLRVGGAMLNGSWRDGRWTAFGDWTYAKVKSDAATDAGLLFSEIEGEVRGNVVQLFGGYDLLQQRDVHLDLYAGARYYDLDIRLGLKGAALADRSTSGDASWVDAVAGARWSARFGNGWNAYVQADVGAGGSDLSWQAIAAVGYDFSWGAVLGGWRHLKVDYEDGPYRMDAALSGPLIGLSFRF